MCVRQWSFKRWPTLLPAATQTFLTDIQSGKFEPRQDGLLLAPPCLLDWSAPICGAAWVAYCKMMGSLSDKGEWGVNCYSAERNHQTSSCRSWRAVSRALQKPSDRGVRGGSPPASGKYTRASAPPTVTLYPSGQKRLSIIWRIYPGCMFYTPTKHYGICLCSFVVSFSLNAAYLAPGNFFPSLLILCVSSKGLSDWREVLLCV